MLIVDDNETDIGGIIRYISWEDLGVNVVSTAPDGARGYEKALEVKPDFVLSDISMPFMNGIEMSEKIKTVLPHTKFIFMSCFDDFEYMQGAINMNACGYVLKPVDLGELTAAIKKMCSLRKAELESEAEVGKLREQFRRSLPLLQEHFMRDLLFGALTDEAEIGERMKLFEADLAGMPYAVLYLDIDNQDIIFRDSPIEKKYYAICAVKNIASAVLLNDCRGYATEIGYGGLAVILFDGKGGASAGADFTNRIMDAADRCREGICKEPDISVTIGISGTSVRLTDAPGLFESARYAVTSKFFSGGNRIVLASDISENGAGQEYNLQEIKNGMLMLLEQDDIVAVTEFIGKYYDPVRHDTQAGVKSLSFSIVNIIQTVLIERNMTFRDIFDSEYAVWDKLSRLETILGIRAWMADMIESVRQSLKKRESGRYQRLADEIKSVIDEKYAVIENINQIVQSLYITPRYANTKFKQQTGETIGDYLQKCRMEAAKRLLQDPAGRVYEVAGMVGYKSTVHFSTVFKGYTGLSPKEYKDKYAG